LKSTVNVSQVEVYSMSKSLVCIYVSSNILTLPILSCPQKYRNTSYYFNKIIAVQESIKINGGMKVQFCILFLCHTYGFSTRIIPSCATLHMDNYRIISWRRNGFALLLKKIMSLEVEDCYTLINLSNAKRSAESGRNFGRK